MNVHIPRGQSLMLCLAASVLMGGCAVQKNPRGQTQISFDEAEVFGQEVQSFRLPDGSEAKLRQLNGRYSLKLQKQWKVIPVDNAVVAEAHSVYTVGGRTVILLTKSSPQCRYQNQLIAIRDNEALNWDLGDCLHAPDVKTYADSMTLDYPRDGGGGTRFVYQEGRLRHGGYSGVAPNAAPVSVAPMPTGAPRYLPGLPSAPKADDRPVASTEDARTPGKPVARPSKPPAAVRTAPPPAPAKPLEFQTQEQKPVRIILDK